jgi:hypothetical protein
MPHLLSHVALSANIRETVLVPLINEQGEREASHMNSRGPFITNRAKLTRRARHFISAHYVLATQAGPRFSAKHLGCATRGERQKGNAAAEAPTWSGQAAAFHESLQLAQKRNRKPIWT